MSTIGRNARARALVPRAVRVRNACVRHAARQLGLPVPDDAALNALGHDVSLGDAVAWWRAQAGETAVAVSAERAGRLLLKAAWIASIAVLGIAFSYGRAQ